LRCTDVFLGQVVDVAGAVPDRLGGDHEGSGTVCGVSR
jgi:hypothetical protein